MAFDLASVTSVGDRMDSNQVYSTRHPTYLKIAAAVTEEVSALARKDAVRKTRAMPVVLTLNVDSVVADMISSDYPEFRPLVYEMDSVGHCYYEVSGYLANEWILQQAARISTSVIHLGGRILTSILSTDADVHLEIDSTSAVAVHNRHRDNRYVQKVMADYAKLAADYGNIPYGRFSDYSRRQHLVACNNVNCSRKADAYCADGSVYAMSVQQFCSGMLQAGASVGYFFFPYHPAMLMSNEGEIPDTGIWFHKDFKSKLLRLKYPSGVCGVEAWPLAAWASWVCESRMVIGRGSKSQYYQIQLLKNRGPFMFAQVIKTQAQPVGVVDRHALELQQAEPMYVVTGWTLKTLASDPSNPDSWKRVVFLAPKKIVDSVFAFGMQLENDVFNRYHIRRQLKLYDRVTIEGSSVRKGYNPTDVELDLLTTCIHAKVFNERYEMHRLSKQMMDRLNAVTGFSNAPTMQRVKAVSLWTMLSAWDFTGGLVADGLSALCGWVEKTFSGNNRNRQPTFELAPEYVTIETLVSRWRRTSDATYRKALAAVGSVGNSQCATLRGYSIVTRLAEMTREVAANVGDIAQATMIHSYHVELRDAISSINADGQSTSDPSREDLLRDIASINQMDEAPHTRHFMPSEVAVRGVNQTDVMVEDQDEDLDYVNTFNEVYEAFNPGMNEQPLEIDIASIAFDDQDKTLVADYMRMPRLNPDKPKDKVVFKSKVKALGAPKRQETTPELVAAISARNLAAPKVSLPQDDSTIIPEIWENFLKVMCVDDAKAKLESYQKDPVALEQNAYRDWMSQSRDDVRKAIAKSVMEFSKPVLEMDISEYLVMLKSDVKPPLSSKPMTSRIEPQVIVYHDKLLSSLYSSIFRIIVRRFLSLLKSNVHVNLLKDQVDIRNFIQAVHPYNASVKYLENDFGKYDKSQDAFAFKLEQYVFEQLGMNQEFLARWVEGHDHCKLRSFNTGLSLHVRFQRKSGDATTAFGNVLLNIMSVAYAYGITRFAWAVFMGDDSLLALYQPVVDERAVTVLAEVFNLTAKMYMTEAPYFASWFFDIQDENRHVAGLPDPIKWIEKRSQMVDAREPHWEDKYRSAAENAEAYKYKFNTDKLAYRVMQRYPIRFDQARRLPAAIYTATKSFENFRNCYEGQSEVLVY